MDLLQNKEYNRKIYGWVSVDYWAKNILLFFIFTMPFISAFSFTETISFPLVFAVFMGALMFINFISTGKLPAGFVGVDIIIVCSFLFLVLYSYCVNALGNSKSLNHTIAYISSLSLFYLTIKFVLFKLKGDDKLLISILKVISYTTIISAVYVNVEFILANFFQFNLNDYVPRPSEAQMYYKPYVIGLFFRARGFASESGAYTQMMELFAPLTIYYLFFSNYCKWMMWIKVTLVVFIVISVIFAASSATFIILPIAIAIAVLIYIRKIIRFLSKKSIAFFLKTSAILGSIWLISNYFSIYASIVLSLTDKVDSTSFEDRQGRIDFFYSKFFDVSFVNKLIGSGPAGFNVLGLDDTRSIISLYYNITFELGFLGLLLLLLLYIYFFISILSLNSKLGFFLLIAFLCGVMHYYVMNNYWVPWLWFIGAIASYSRSLSSTLKGNKNSFAIKEAAQ